MKQVIWYLPSGSGGMAALHRANRIKLELLEWANRHAPELDIHGRLTFYSENGLRYYALRFSEEHATMFALTWDNDKAWLHYEYINDYIPSVHPE